MRVYGEKENIDYAESKSFFQKRASRFNADNPYSVTMYQDNNQKLVEERNRRETEKLLPYLSVGKDTKVLDIACGIGRWADALPESICEYCGIDFSEELVRIAQERNTRKNFYFYTGEVGELEKVIARNRRQKYNTILMMGILIYINDGDIEAVLSQVERVCDDHCIICMREPVALQDRLTLKDFYSEELKDNYNAIYRTREELEAFFKKAFLDKGFQVRRQDFLFEDALNNRKETAQYFYILER